MSDAARQRSLSMRWQGLAVACFVLAIGIAGFWQMQGGSNVTKYQVPVEKEIEDDFGDTEVVTVMQDQFVFGLLPDKGYDGALPWLGLFGGLGVVSVIMAVRARPKG